MSGEYYYNEEQVKHYQKEYDVLPDFVKNKENLESKGQDPRLHEIEEQLEMAEDRCNTLKGQLDYMKQLYGVTRSSPKTRKISCISPENKSPISGSSMVNEAGNEKNNRSYLKRQNSTAIGTDNTGAAVRTINNILNGITDSVNRLSELHVQISETPRNRKARSTGVSPHPVTAMKITSHSNNELVASRKTASFANEQDNGDPGAFGDVSSIPNKKSKVIKKKGKDFKLQNRKSVSSQQSIKRNNKLERRIKNFSSRTSTLDRSVTTIMKRRVLNSLKPTNIQSQSQAHKLVEIYHNTAAKNSDSDEGNLQKGKARRRLANPNKKCSESGNEIPPIDIPEKNESSVGCQEGDGGDAPAPPQDTLRSTEQPFALEPLQAPRTEVSCYSKNYELPTIASRMKQVAKSYLNSFTFKAIPFCAAISTSPSHNIGINIQQVMNIIKNRQPIRGISPTLAHNIGLAAERLNSKPLSALVSTIHSRTGYGTSQCPLSKTFFNYPQLQEMARGIPEETAEEVEEEVIDSPEVKTIIITGPSGDMEVRSRNTPIWAADPLKSQEQCTCAPESGVELQHVVNKYRRLPQGKNVGKKWQNCSRNGYLTVSNTASAGGAQEMAVESTALQGREKNLKEVLTNLHDEFEALNKKYEELSNKASADDEETLRELEKMEAELTKKEEEITMVMTLYKEVIALKQQIKNLKEKTSQASVNTNASDVKFKEYNNPQAAFHLTKLLRQIQHYQMRYKRDFTGV